MWINYPVQQLKLEFFCACCLFRNRRGSRLDQTWYAVCWIPFAVAVRLINISVCYKSSYPWLENSPSKWETYSVSPSLRGIQTCIPTLMEEPPPFQWKQALDRMDWRICVPGKWARVVMWLSTSCGNTLRPTQQILQEFASLRHIKGNILQSCPLWPLFAFWHSLELFSVQCHSFLGGVWQQGHAHN